MSNAKHNFGEKETEYSTKTGGQVPVVLTAKYKAAKAKAIELIDKGNYKLSDADFWILMNSSKNGTEMYYSGLIISHNGCLKINDALNSKFCPSSVTVDKLGFNNSLTYTYSNDEQGIYEVGEVSTKNCKNEYPYAMAFKRLFDRVVLKLSKIAYDGIYSESESDEFKKQYGDSTEKPSPKKEKSSMQTDDVEYVLEADVKRLVKILKEKNIAQKDICSNYGIKSLRQLTMEQYSALCESLV